MRGWALPVQTNTLDWFQEHDAVLLPPSSGTDISIFKELSFPRKTSCLVFTHLEDLGETNPFSLVGGPKQRGCVYGCISFNVEFRKSCHAPWLGHLYGEKWDAGASWKVWMHHALVAVAGPFRASLFFFGRTRSPCMGANPSDISRAPQPWEVEHVSFPRSLGRGLKRLSPGRR